MRRPRSDMPSQLDAACPWRPLMLRWNMILPTSPQGTIANEVRAEVLLAISREFYGRSTDTPGIATL